MSRDERWMARALMLARRGAGTVSPNPMVGCVIVDGDEVLGEGWHGRFGGPHAEVWAVRDVYRRGHTDRLAGATAYVTLEPCSHHGKTPPCADLLVRERLGRVVVALRDPNPQVAGRGLARLREAGIEVELGVRRAEAFRLTEAFLHHVTTGRPLVTLKLAQTLDGRLATRSGDSKWVSGEASRALVHRWRAEMDAVLVGAGTAAADDPALTVRHVPLAEGQRHPLRVVLDRAGRLAPSLRLWTDAHAARTVAVVSERAEPGYAEALRASGGMLLRVPERGGHLDLGALLDRLGAGEGLPEDVRPVQSLLVEAGPGLATALLAQDLADRLAVFVAPKILGAGREAVGDLGIGAMADALTFAEHRWEAIGEDMAFTGFRRERPSSL